MVGRVLKIVLYSMFIALIVLWFWYATNPKQAKEAGFWLWIPIIFVIFASLNFLGLLLPSNRKKLSRQWQFSKKTFNEGDSAVPLVTKKYWKKMGEMNKFVNSEDNEKK